MATANEIVSGALRLLGIQAAESAIESNEAQDGLTSLNDMMNEWDTAGIKVGYETVADIDDEVFVDEHAIGAIKANLAVYVAPEYNRPVSDALAIRARDSKNALRASIPIRGSEFPDTLPIGSGNESNNFSVNGDIPGGVLGNRFYPPNVKSKCN